MQKIKERKRDMKREKRREKRRENFDKEAGKVQ